MAGNLWDTLSEEERNSLARQAIVGSESTPANLSRAREQLANNPNLVKRLATEAGIGEEADPNEAEGDNDLDDTRPDEDMDQDNSNDIERTVNEALDNEADVQETGELTSDIPPPQKGEDMQGYIARLIEMQQGDEQLNPRKRRAPQMPGVRPSDE